MHTWDQYPLQPFQRFHGIHKKWLGAGKQVRLR
ncbi:hypothetical protein LTSESEN_4620, partial [Salmonella enterica subsp. enterica serovar Senftenberg str. A4-543]